MQCSVEIKPIGSIKRNSLKDKIYNYRYLLLMIMPAVIHVFIFSYIPMGGIILAFKSYDFNLGIFGSPWVGLENFKYFFMSGQAWNVTKNTVLYNLMFIIVGHIIQIIVALFLSELANRKLVKVFQTGIFLPYFISWVIVAGMMYGLISTDYGVINSLLKSFGIEPINFYATPGLWPWILLIANTWKGVGYGSVNYLATIKGIDTSIYEAAEIDGANIWQRIWHITLRELVPTMLTLLLLAMGGIFRGNFDMFYQLIGNNGNLQRMTDVIDTVTFRALMQTKDFGMSSATGLYQSVLCFVFIVTVNKIVNKIDSGSALF